LQGKQSRNQFIESGGKKCYYTISKLLLDTQIIEGSLAEIVECPQNYLTTDEIVKFPDTDSKANVAEIQPSSRPNDNLTNKDKTIDAIQGSGHVFLLNLLPFQY
jgi:hypothetical protein